MIRICRADFTQLPGFAWIRQYWCISHHYKRAPSSTNLRSLFQREESESCIFMLLHNFTFTRPLIVDATKMKHTMYHYPIEFSDGRLREFGSITFHSGERNHDVARNAISMSGIEGDDICKIIMIQELPVHLQNFFIITKEIGEASYHEAMRSRHVGNPSPNQILIEIRHLNIFDIKIYHDKKTLKKRAANRAPLAPFHTNLQS